MRLALLSDPHNFHTQKWAMALVRAGADVRTFSFDPPAATGPPHTQLPLKGKLNYAAYLHGGPALLAALKAHDIQVVNALNLTPFGVWAARSGFKPLILSAMGADVWEFLPGRLRPPGLAARSWDNLEGRSWNWQAQKARLLRPLYRRWVQQALAAADLITADNQPLIDALQAGFGVASDRVELLRFGLEPDLFVPDPALLADVLRRLGIPAGKRIVLSPRGLKSVYQADIILDGFQRVLATGRSDTCFVLLGAGYPVAPSLLAQAANAPQGLLRIITERLSRAELAQLWNVVDIFVSAPVYDGYSAAVAEGRYAGAVPLVNAIPGNLEVIQHGDNGWICDPFNGGTLAAVLGQLLDAEPGWRRQVAGKNRAWIIQHSLVDPNAERLLTLAERLI
jgi:glycosyltransferase involved in cell wall biosynthesis